MFAPGIVTKRRGRGPTTEEIGRGGRACGGWVETYHERAVVRLVQRWFGRSGWEVRVAVTDEAIEKIKEMIVSRQLGPGDRLPKEDDLAQALGLSRNSLREAVRALSLIHILDVRQGDGTYVTSLEPDLLLDALSFVVDFHRDDSVLHFLEVRRILEPAATGMAAIRATPADVAELRTLMADMTPASSVDKLVQNDLQFHGRIVALSGNPVLASLLDKISAPTTRARIWRGLTQEDAVQRTLTEHAAIVDALEMRDATLAAARATVHIAGVDDWLRRAR
ncbi:MAG: GntR family transcriptional regulator, transcriptional repressor for pyruvate dehydrogenase complex [Actinomycetota bacterium]|jgi:DNA-binding FadR family transcriptional regulator|nr:GntR family transcriptional regulator, transcriptional repressor for pyruvate dehydrogenase complex [Actinomycetota bacterium]